MQIEKKIIEQKWFLRIGIFFLVLIPLLMIKNEFHMADEYWCALALDQGLSTFHIYHILSSVNGYFAWFLATILGFKISAFRALQVGSSIMAAIGAVALVDLAIFLGLRWTNALLFSLPIILSNAFVRYGTSAYPDAAAMGMGLVAANLVIRAVSKQENIRENAICFKSLYFSGLIAGIAGLMHVAVLPLVPGFGLGILFRLRQLKQSLTQISLSFGYYCLGILSILVVGYTFLFIFFKLIPEQVCCWLSKPNTVMALLVGKAPQWLPSVSDLIINVKTFIALFVPGVHSGNRILDLALNIPRVVAFLIFCWMFCKAWKKRNESPSISVWIIPMGLSILTLFLVLFSINWSQCRQYAYVGLAAFGPLFLAVGISALRKGASLFRVPIVIISAVFVFHMIFGIEGLIEIVTHDSRPFRKVYEKCDIHRPKPIQFPWNVDEGSLHPDCR